MVSVRVAHRPPAVVVESAKISQYLPGRIGEFLVFHSLGRTYQQRCHTLYAVIFIGAPQVLHITGQNGTEES